MNLKITAHPIFVQDIKFRSKFMKHIKDLSEETYEGLKKVAIRFVNDSNNDKCLEILWKITYDPDTALNMLGISIEDDIIIDEEAEKNIQIPRSIVENFRNELRYQKKIVHPEFMEINIPEACQEAFKNFLKASADPIVTTACCNHCNVVYDSFTNEEITRILFLLECPNESNYFGGIRSLKFGYAQAVCLKKYVEQIHDYLEGLWYGEESVESGNTPMAIPLTKWQQTYGENAEDVPEIEDIAEIANSSEQGNDFQIPESSDEKELHKGLKFNDETTEGVDAEKIMSQENLSEMFSEEPLFCELLTTSMVLLVKKIVRNYCDNDSIKASRLITQIRAGLSAKENWNTK